MTEDSSFVAYEVPTLVELGSFESLTNATSAVFSHFDATYSSGSTFPTPFS